MTRKKTLVLAQVMPALGGSGMGMRLGNILEALAADSDVTLAIASDRITVDETAPPYWLAKCARILIANVVSEATPFKAAQHRPLTRLFDSRPKEHAVWPLDAVLNRLKALRGEHFDQVLVVRLRLMPVWRALQQRLGIVGHWTVLDLDDIESRSQARQVRLLGVPYLGKISFVLEWLETGKLVREEARAFKEMDRVIICSQEDSDTLSGRFDRKQIAIVPNTVRLPEQLPPRASDGKLRLLFVGTLDYPPNEDAVKWLTESILPQIEQLVGTGIVTLTVIGHAPPRWMRERAANGAFALYADVPEVRPFYEACDVVVVPIRAGGGTRIKILEAFGFGRLVVSTTTGAEGISGQDRIDCLIEDSPQGFVDAVAMLIEQPEVNARIVCAARATVAASYSSERCARAVQAAFSKTLI